MRSSRIRQIFIAVLLATLIMVLIEDLHAESPQYAIPLGAPAEYAQALAHIRAHADTDDFRDMMLKKRTRAYTFTTLPPEVVIKRFYECFRRLPRIHIHIVRNFYPEGALGGRRGNSILENELFLIGDKARARHIMHETAHICGFTHGSEYKLSDENLQSFPYALGYDFEEYLGLKLKE